MAPLAVRQREGDPVVAPSAPLAVGDAHHGHVVLPLGRDEYLRVADLALEPEGVHLVRVDYVVDEIALCQYKYVELKGRQLIGLRVKGVLRLYYAFSYELRPVYKAVPVLGQPCGRKGLGVPSVPGLISHARGLCGVPSAGELARCVEVYYARRVCGVYLGVLLRALGIGETTGQGKTHKHNEREEEGYTCIL